MKRPVKGTSSVLLVQLLLETGMKAGLRRDELVRVAGLTSKVLADPRARVPRAKEHALWAHIATETGDDAFGLHLAETSVACGVFGLLEYLIRGSTTLRVACQQVEQFLPLLFDGDVVVNERRAEGRVVFGYRRGLEGPPLTRHPEECAVAAFVLLVRRLLGPSWSPDSISFEHAAPRDVGEHRRIFGAPMRFGEGLNGIVFAEHWLDRTSSQGDARLLALLREYSRQVLQALPQANSCVEDVRRLLAQWLPERVLSVADAAEQLALSVRSLQRRLSEEGTSFSELVEDVQIAMAHQLLEQGRMAVGDVARHVGYSDQNAFSRAFKRATGKTPSQAARRGASEQKIGALEQSGEFRFVRYELRLHEVGLEQRGLGSPTEDNDDV